MECQDFQRGHVREIRSISNKHRGAVGSEVTDDPEAKEEMLQGGGSDVMLKMLLGAKRITELTLGFHIEILIKTDLVKLCV